MSPQFTNGKAPGATLAFGLLGRLSAVPLACVIWLAVAEWFPTSVRSLVLGIGAASGRIGCIVCPLLVNGSLVGGALIVGIFLGFCCIITLFLSESKGATLADVVTSAPVSSGLKTGDMKSVNNA